MTALKIFIVLSFTIVIYLSIYWTYQSIIRKDIFRNIKNESPNLKSKNKISKYFYQSDLSLSFKAFLVTSLLFATILFFLLYFLFQSFLLSLSGVLIFTTSVIYFIAQRIKKINQKINGQIPHFLDSLSRSLKTGHSLEKAFIYAIKNISDPLHKNLKEIPKLLEYNQRLVPLLEKASLKISNEDFDLVVNSLGAVRLAGGNIPVMLENISKVSRERIKLQKDVETFTSQGKLSGIIVALLWPISIIIFTTLSPGYFDVMLTTLIGRIALTVAIIFEIIGFYWILKIINIKL